MKRNNLIACILCIVITVFVLSMCVGAKGTIQGADSSNFNTSDNLTVQQAIVLASRIHSTYYGNSVDYSQDDGVYYRYAIANGFLQSNSFDDLTRAITRLEFAALLADALPQSAFVPINQIDAIPDVDESNPAYHKLLLLYKAGIVLGSDNEGAFYPDAQITIGQARHLINRIIFVHSRINKDLVTLNTPGNAVYYIDDKRAGDYGWNFDNRFQLFNKDGTTNTMLNDNSTEQFTNINRSFATQSDGLLALDMQVSIVEDKDGLYFKLAGKDGATAIELISNGGYLTTAGKTIPVPFENTSNGRVLLSLRLDLDRDVADVYINGVYGGQYAIEDISINKFEMGISKSGMGAMQYKELRLYGYYSVNEVFGYVPTDSLPCDWNFDGAFSVCEKGGTTAVEQNSLKISANAGTTNIAIKEFRQIKGNVVAQAVMLMPEGQSSAFVSIGQGEKTAVKVATNENSFVSGNTQIREYSNNVWQLVRIEADTDTQTAVIKINGKKCATVNFENAVSYINNIKIGFNPQSAGEVWFDDIEVFTYTEPGDYVPTPVPAQSDDYIVGMTMCPLWREGSHYGWDRISAFPDLEPVLGYYDEGIAELSDWEIKYMVEHGIDYQHICWYAPQSDSNQPIKEHSYSYPGIHDGYFNAKYSDMIKFTIMWENSGVNCKNLEQFEEYIWNYWKDYYFTDPRMMTLDGKLVFTVYNYANFISAFGGEQQAKQAVVWMREQAEDMGYDGLVLLFCGAHAANDQYREKLEQLGADGYFAYHYNVDGKDADFQINKMNSFIDGGVYYMPTISTGFNSVGWLGTRKDLITPEGFAQVADYVKNTYLPAFDSNTWQGKAVLLSNWNEYGEGTYIMPSDGLYGFDYLDVVREYFTNASEQHTDVVPTEQQKARICLMYDRERSAIKYTEYETLPDIQPDYVIKSWSFADSSDFAQWKTFGIDPLENKGGALMGTFTGNEGGMSLNEPISVDAAVASCITVRAKVSANTTAQIYFITDDDSSWTQDKVVSLPIQASDNYTEYCFEMNTNSKWKGTVTDIRLDIMSCAGSFEITDIKFMSVQKPYGARNLVINGIKYNPTLPAWQDGDGEYYVPMDPKKGAFSLLNLYYEFSRFTGRLYVANKDTEFIFNIGSNKVLVNGVEYTLEKSVTLRDGMPVLPLIFMANHMNYTCTMDDTNLSIVTGEIYVPSPAYEWDWSITGNTEGWSAGSTGTSYWENGALAGSASQPDLALTSPEFSIDAQEFNKLKISMKYSYPNTSSEALQVFFRTSDQPSFSENKSAKIVLQPGNSNGEFIEYELDFSNNSAWKGTITQIRIDPFNAYGDYALDYVKFIKNPDYEEDSDNKEYVSATIINGDASDETNLAFTSIGTQNSTVSIAKDPDDPSNNVYRVGVGAPSSLYLYAVQKVNWNPGSTYVVEYDLRVLNTSDGNAVTNANVQINLRYTDAVGNVDHTISLPSISTSDGWVHVEKRFSIGESYFRDADLFALYSNPTAGMAVEYLFDNVKLTEIKELQNPVYLIDDKEPKESSWNFDNRFNILNYTGGAVAHLEDDNTEKFVSMNRSFKAQQSGILSFDAHIKLYEDNDGIYFNFTNDEKQECFKLISRDGYLITNNKVIPIAFENSSSGNVKLKIVMDLDFNTATVYINGVNGGKFPMGDYPINKYEMGITAQGMGSFQYQKMRLYSGYAVNETFETTNTNELPQDWDFNGQISLDAVGGVSGLDVYSAQIKAQPGSVNSAKKTFTAMGGKVISETYMLLPKGTSGAYVALKSGEKIAVKIMTDGNDFVSADGTVLRSYTDNVWQLVRIEADTDCKTALIKIDGKQCATIPFENNVSLIDSVVVGFEPEVQADMWFDDILVWTYKEPDDYVPTPVPVASEHYNVGISMCSLWHEGHHFGWDEVSAFPDIEPVLGYYDEGIAEVADWEIKFMVEHGIDFQLLCWYAPQSNSTQPIKKPNLVYHALHDGFFNAKYSDMMKFAIMWENIGGNCTNLAQFKEYIWKYWKEYYFTDPRYMTIENKIVFTVYNYNKFVSSFGGKQEAKQAIEWMRQDAVDMGFDGIIILFCDGHSMAQELFANLAEIGADGVYAYHWNKEGKTASGQIDRMEKQYDYGIIHTVPTIGMGFNDIGWTGERKDLISLEEYAFVADFIKNTQFPKYEAGSWKSNTLIIATWNEYGEGHYIMPSNGLYGFGFLDTIREYFTNSGSTAHNDAIPTQSQKARLNGLYDSQRSYIKALDYKSPSAETPVDVVKNWNFSKALDYLAWESFDLTNVVRKNSAFCGTYTKKDGGISLKQPIAVAAKDIPYLHIRAKTSVKSDVEVYFITDADCTWTKDKCVTYSTTVAGEYADYYIPMKNSTHWIGNIINIRIDIMNGVNGNFEISHIEFMDVEKSQKNIVVNGFNYTPRFAPVFENNECYMVMEPENGAFGLLNLYYEFSRFTGSLFVATKDTEFAFNIGSNEVLVNGTLYTLDKAVEMIDGLPVLPIKFIASKAGYTVNETQNVLTINYIPEEYIDDIISRKDYEWNWTIPGDAMGWHGGNSVIVSASDGTLNGVSINSDPIVLSPELELSADKYNKLKISMKHKYSTYGRSSFQIFFATDSEPSFTEDKSEKLYLTRNDSGDFVEYEFDFSNNAKWKGKITGIRIDPFNAKGEFWFDYVEFVQNPNYVAPAVTSIVNGDAEDTDNVAFTSVNANVTIDKDPKDPSNNVYKFISNKNGQAWTYGIHPISWVPGATYRVEFDFMFIGTNDGSSSVGTTNIAFNAQYLDDSGVTDHSIGNVSASSESGWVHFSKDFNIGNSTQRDKDLFSFYVNPYNEKAVNMVVDNIRLVKIADPVLPTVIINGDASDTTNVAFTSIGAQNSVVSIVSDPDNAANYVYKVEPKTQTSTYIYFLQNVNWHAGKTYKIDFDFRITTDIQGNEVTADNPTSIAFNARYQDSTLEHIIKTVRACTADGWQHFSTQVTIGNYLFKQSDAFSIYTNPISGGTMGVSYLIDNVTVVQLD